MQLNDPGIIRPGRELPEDFLEHLEPFSSSRKLGEGFFCEGRAQRLAPKDSCQVKLDLDLDLDLDSQVRLETQTLDLESRLRLWT